MINDLANLFPNRQMNSHRIGSMILLLTVLVGCTTKKGRVQFVKNKEGDRHSTWWEYGGGPDQSKFTDFTQINVSSG